MRKKLLSLPILLLLTLGTLSCWSDNNPHGSSSGLLPKGQKTSITTGVRSYFPNFEFSSIVMLRFLICGFQINGLGYPILAQPVFAKKHCFQHSPLFESKWEDPTRTRTMLAKIGDKN